ncbi:MAG: GumC family protein, partial [Beijerinckiaceae bacterium]
MSAAERGEIDLVQLLREVGRRKWLVLGAGVVALVLSTVGVNMVKPRFTAESRVLLENRETAYTSIGRDTQRGQEPLIDQDAVLSQEQLIQSRDVARAMIRKFDLTSKPEFDPVLDGVSPVVRVGVMLGLLDNPARLSPEERVMDVYFERLKVFGLKKSRVIAVEFQSRDPELAAKMALGIAEEYIRQLEQAKRGSALSAGTWLGRTVEEARQRVAVAEAKAEAYRTQNGLFQVDSDKTNLSSQQLSEMNTQLATVRAQQTELSSRARVIREAIRQGRIFEVSEIVNNELVRRLIETRATLRAQIAQEERTLLPQHPRLKEIYAQLAGLEDQIRAAADRTARTLDNDARAAGARVAATQAELDAQKRQSGVSNEAEVQLRALEREAKAEREQLENFLARYRDATVRESDNAVTADARIVSQPLVPGLPSFPKKLPVIIIATLAALILSLFYVLMRALLSDAVYVRRPMPAYHQPMAEHLPQLVAAPAPSLAPQPAAIAPAMPAPAAGKLAMTDTQAIPEMQEITDTREISNNRD